MKVAVLGIGNEMVADDGVAIHTVRLLRSVVPDTRVYCLESERGGMDILDQLEGFERAFVIDASCSGLHPAGTINRYVIRAPFGQSSPPSLHTVSLNAVLALGSTTGLRLPEEVFIYTIEATDIETFGAGCTERVQRAIPEAVSRLKADILSILPDASCVPRQGKSVHPFPPGPCTSTQVLKQR